MPEDRYSICHRVLDVFDRLVVGAASVQVFLRRGRTRAPVN